MDLFLHTRLLELRELIKKYNHYYYDLSNPIISDFEYDKLYKELEYLELQNLDIKDSSPIKKIGEEMTGKISRIKHKTPMISLSNSYDRGDIYSWNERIKKIFLDFSKKEDISSLDSDFSEIFRNIKKTYPCENNLFYGDKSNLSKQSVLKDFLFNNLEYVLEPKIDGVSISITYIDGKVSQCLSRGDGIFGEDITSNLLTSSEIPLFIKSDKYFIPKVLEIRGEAYIDKETLQNLNKINKEKGEDLFANSRNAVSGTLKLLNLDLVKERNIRTFFYALGYFEDDKKNTFAKNIDTQEKFLDFLKSIGFKVNNNIEKYRNIDDTVNAAIDFVNNRDLLPYDIDGMVIKVNSFFEQKILGNTIKFPRWAISYKFPAKQITTILKDIVVQVGRTGVLTPVAILEPCSLGGVVIKKATLHNFDEIKRLKIKIGSRVLIERSADVIPKIIKVMPDENENSFLKVFHIPMKCPVCGTNVVKFDDEVAYRCPNNISCKAHLSRSIEFFVSKKGMNIEGLGEKIIDELISKNYLSSLFDIYKLKKENFLSLNLFKDKKASNLINNIEKSKKVELRNFLYSLGIRHIGERASKILSKKYKTFYDISKSSETELKNIENFGTILAKSIRNFFDENLDIFVKIENSGIEIRNSEYIDLEKMDYTEKNFKNFSVFTNSYSENSGFKNKFQNNFDWFGYNKNFVITGKFDIPREEITNFIEKKGGKVLQSVSKNVDFLIVGKNDLGKDSSKYKKALSLGIEIIDKLEKIYD